MVDTVVLAVFALADSGLLRQATDGLRAADIEPGDPVEWLKTDIDLDTYYTDKYDTAVGACHPEKIYIEYSTGRNMNDAGFATLPGYSSAVHFVEEPCKKRPGVAPKESSQGIGRSAYPARRGIDGGAGFG